MASDKDEPARFPIVVLVIFVLLLVIVVGLSVLGYIQ